MLVELWVAVRGNMWGEVLLIRLIVDVVVDTVTDSLINVLTAVTVGVGIGGSVGVKIVMVTFALIAFDLVVAFVYVGEFISDNWAEALIDIVVSIVGRAGD